MATPPWVSRGEAGQMSPDDVPKIYKDAKGNVLTEVEQWMVAATRSPGFLLFGYVHEEYGETVQREPTQIRFARKMDVSQQVAWRRPDSGAYTVYHGTWSYDHESRQVTAWFHNTGITALCDQAFKFKVTSEDPFTLTAHVAGARRGVHVIRLRLQTTCNSSTWYIPPGTAAHLKEYEQIYEGSVLIDYAREYRADPPPPPGPPPTTPQYVRLPQMYRDYSADITELGFTHLSLEDGQVSAQEREMYKEPLLTLKQHSMLVTANFGLLEILLVMDVENCDAPHPMLNVLPKEPCQTYSSRGGVVIDVQTLYWRRVPTGRRYYPTASVSVYRLTQQDKARRIMSDSKSPDDQSKASEQAPAESHNVTVSEDSAKSPGEDHKATAEIPSNNSVENKAEGSKPTGDNAGAQPSLQKTDIASSSDVAQWLETKFCDNCRNERPLPTQTDVILHIEKTTSGRTVCCGRCHRTKGEKHDVACERRHQEYLSKASKAVVSARETLEKQVTSSEPSVATPLKKTSSEDKEPSSDSDDSSSGEHESPTAEPAAPADEEGEEEEPSEKDEIEEDDSDESSSEEAPHDPRDNAQKKDAPDNSPPDSKSEAVIAQLRKTFPGRPTQASGPWSFQKYLPKIGLVHPSRWYHLAKHVMYEHWPEAVHTDHATQQRKEKIELHLQRIRNSSHSDDPKLYNALTWFEEAMWDLYEQIGRNEAQGMLLRGRFEDEKYSRAGRESKVQRERAQMRMLQDLHRRVALLATSTVEGSKIVREIEEKIKEQFEPSSDAEQVKLIEKYEDMFQSEIFIDEHWTSLTACRKLELLDGSKDEDGRDVIAIIRTRPTRGPLEDASDDECGDSVPLLKPTIEMPLSPHWITRLGIYIDGRKHSECYVPYNVYTTAGQVVDAALAQLGGVRNVARPAASLWETVYPLPPTVRNHKPIVNTEEYDNWVTYPKRLPPVEFLHSIIPPQTALALIVITNQHRREVEQIVKQSASIAVMNEYGAGQPVKLNANLRAYFHLQNDRRKISEHTLKCLFKAVEDEIALSAGPTPVWLEPTNTKKRNRPALSANIAEGTPAVKSPMADMMPYKYAMLGGLQSKTMNRRRNLTVAEELNQTQLHYCEPIHTKDLLHDSRSLIMPVFSQLDLKFVQKHIKEVITTIRDEPDGVIREPIPISYQHFPLTKCDLHPDMEVIGRIMKARGNVGRLRTEQAANPDIKSIETTWTDPLGKTAQNWIDATDPIPPREPDISPTWHLQRRYNTSMGKIPDAGEKRLMCSERARLLKARPQRNPEYFQALCEAVGLRVDDKISAEDPQCARTALEAHILLDPTPKWHRPLGNGTGVRDIGPTPLVQDLLTRERLARELALAGVISYDQAKKVNDNITEHVMHQADQVIQYRDISAFEFRPWLAEIHGVNKETEDPWSGRACPEVGLPADGAERAKIQFQDCLNRDRLPHEEALRSSVKRDPIQIGGQVMMAVYHRKFGHTSVPNHHQQDAYTHDLHYSGPDDARWESNHLDIPSPNQEGLLSHEIKHRVLDKSILDRRAGYARTDTEQRFNRMKDQGAMPEVYAAAAAAYLDKKPRSNDFGPENEVILKDLLTQSGKEFFEVLSKTLCAEMHPDSSVVFASVARSSDKASEISASPAGAPSSEIKRGSKPPLPPVPLFNNTPEVKTTDPARRVVYTSPATTQGAGEHAYIKKLEDDHDIDIDAEVPTQLLSNDALKKISDEHGKAMEYKGFKLLMIELCSKRNYAFLAAIATEGSNGKARCKNHYECGRFAKPGLAYCCTSCEDTKGFAEEYYGHTCECAIRCGLYGSVTNAYYFDERMNHTQYRKPYLKKWKQNCVEILTTANGNIRKRIPSKRPKGWIDIPRETMEAYKKFANGEGSEPVVPWGRKLAKDYPQLEAHEIDMAHLRNIQPRDTDLPQIQVDPSPPASEVPPKEKICVKCGIYPIHKEQSVSQGKYCCNKCFKTDGREHGVKCVSKSIAQDSTTHPIAQQQDRPTEETVVSAVDSKNPKRPNAEAEDTASTASAATSAVKRPKTEEAKPAKKPKPARETDKLPKSKRPKPEEEQTEEPQGDKVRPKRSRRVRWADMAAEVKANVEKKKQESAAAEATVADANDTAEVDEASSKKKRKKLGRKPKPQIEEAAQSSTSLSNSK